jgi:transcriptional regulator with XRE-family HTH domain
VVAQAPSTRVGGRARARREALKLTQDELAHELGVTHQHVSRIESDQAAPSLDLLVKLSHRLGVTPYAAISAPTRRGPGSCATTKT